MRRRILEDAHRGLSGGLFRDFRRGPNFRNQIRRWLFFGFGFLTEADNNVLEVCDLLSEQ